jgi:hypothetical protein
MRSADRTQVWKGWGKIQKIKAEIYEGKRKKEGEELRYEKIIHR